METTMQGVAWKALPDPDAGTLEDRGSCPYLPGRRFLVRQTEDASTPRDYEQGLVHGWRRAAMFFYRPVCPGCSQCIPIRIECSSWVPGTRMRRLMKHNRDISQICGYGYSLDESFQLYLHYSAARHGSQETNDEKTRSLYRAVYCLDYFYHPKLPGFAPPDRRARGERSGSRKDSGCTERRRVIGLCYSPMRDRTDVIEYRRNHDGALVANGYIDVLPTGISSVYFTFDPAESKRSLGLWSIGEEIKLTLELERRYYYLGFWVPGARTMDYKALFPPFELAVNGRWVPVATREDALALAATLPGFAAGEGSPGIGL